MDTISQLLQAGKGILAADESLKTLSIRFAKIGLKSSPETDLAYRKMLFTTPGIEEFLSGVILFDETIRQSIEGQSVCEYLESKGIVPGIKVDQGTLDFGHGEKITQGLEGLEERVKEYKNMGAKFTKWRAVVKIGEGIPTQDCLDQNAQMMAKYAKLVQKLGLLPAIEPEVLRDGGHDLKDCQQITIQNLKTVFKAIAEEAVSLENLLIKTNMVTNGQDQPNQASPEEVARTSVNALWQSVPKQVPGILFLSGGQSPDMATANLNTICKIGGPWDLTFSFSRALQNEPMEIWAGKEENVPAAQKVFQERGKKVALARQGKLS